MSMYNKYEIDADFLVDDPVVVENGDSNSSAQ